MTGFLGIFLREMMIIRKRIFKMLLSFSVSPMLYMVAFGLGLGRRLEVENVQYLIFLVPGLIAMSTMGQSFAISSEINISRFYWKIFEEFQSAPVSCTAIALGEVFAATLGNKLGIERYGFYLPMDDSLAQVAIDFGGRNWLVWEANFKREMIGKMPTEMFFHFFKSFTDGAKCNLNIKAEGSNEHHKIEAIFKAFAKAIKMAVKRDIEKMILPSTKGVL